MQRLLTVLSLFTIGCGPAPHSETTDTGSTDTGTTVDTDTTVGTDLAINGVYTDNFGADHTVTNALWTYAYGAYPPSYFAITTYDNAERYAIAQNDVVNSYYGGLFSRFDWLVDSNDAIWFCQTTFTAATEADALATLRPDDSDPANSGCSGFSWTNLTP